MIVYLSAGEDARHHAEEMIFGSNWRRCHYPEGVSGLALEEAERILAETEPTLWNRYSERDTYIGAVWAAPCDSGKDNNLWLSPSERSALTGALEAALPLFDVLEAEARA